MLPALGASTISTLAPPRRLRHWLTGTQPLPQKEFLQTACMEARARCVSMFACVHWPYRYAPTIKGTGPKWFQKNKKQKECVPECSPRCVCLHLGQRRRSSRLRLVPFMRPEGTRGRVGAPWGNQLGPSKRWTLLGAGGKLHTLTLGSAAPQPLTALYGSGIPVEEAARDRGRGGKPPARLELLGFRSAAKTIATLEGQIGFHLKEGVQRQVRALGAGRGGQMAVQKWQNATLVIFLYKGALM